MENSDYLNSKKQNLDSETRKIKYEHLRQATSARFEAKKENDEEMVQFWTDEINAIKYDLV